MNAITITTKEALEREAQHRGIAVYGPVPPECIIPMVESAIRQHNERRRGLTEPSAEYTEWKAIMDDLQQFLAVLKTLPPDLPYEKQTANPPGDGSTTRQKIQQLNKEIDEHISNLPPSIQQQLTGVDHPSPTRPRTRRTPRQLTPPKPKSLVSAPNTSLNSCAKASPAKAPLMTSRPNARKPSTNSPRASL